MTNARFEDLEKRVKKLKLIRYIKIFFVLLIFSSVSFFTLDFKEENPKLVNKPLHVKKKEIIPVKKKVQEYLPVTNNIEVKKEEKIIEEKTAYDTLKLSPNITLPAKEEVLNEVVEEEVIEKDIVKKKKLNFVVKEVKSEEALLERFKVAKDFESALHLSNLYFDKKRYEKAIYWSKKASKIESKEAKPWIIYAKSKFEQGKKSEAISSLELYLDYFSSDAIEKLLRFYRSKK